MVSVASVYTISLTCIPSSAWVTVTVPPLTVMSFTAFIPSSPAFAVTVPPVITMQPLPEGCVCVVAWSVPSSRYARLDALAFNASPKASIVMLPPPIVRSVSACIPSPVFVSVVVTFVSVSVVSSTYEVAFMPMVPPFIVTVPPETYSAVASDGARSERIPSPREVISTTGFPLIVTEVAPSMPCFCEFTVTVPFPVIVMLSPPMAFFCEVVTASISPSPFIITSPFPSIAFLAAEVNEAVTPLSAVRVMFAPLFAATAAAVELVTETSSTNSSVTSPAFFATTILPSVSVPSIL